MQNFLGINTSHHTNKKKQNQDKIIIIIISFQYLMRPSKTGIAMSKGQKKNNKSDIKKRDAKKPTSYTF